MTGHSLFQPPLLARWKPLIGVLACVAIVPFQAAEVRANTWYEARLMPLPEGQATSDGAALTCNFPRDPVNNHLPGCSTEEPMRLDLHFPDMEGELIAIVFRFDGYDGAEFARVASEDETIPFGTEECSVLSDRELVDDEMRTPLFIVVETSAHPLGAVGGPLVVVEEQPTIEWSWGRIKSTFDESIEGARRSP